MDTPDPQDFQTELKLQDPGTKDTKAGRSEGARTARDKKPDARPDDSPDRSNDDLNIVTAAPAQPADPPKQLPALALSLSIPEESAKPAESAGPTPAVQPIEGGGQQDSRGSAPAAADKTLGPLDRQAPSTDLTRPDQPAPYAAPSLTNLKTATPAASPSSRKPESTPAPELLPSQQPAVQVQGSSISAPAPRKNSEDAPPEIRAISENTNVLAAAVMVQPIPSAPGEQQTDTKNAPEAVGQPVSNAQASSPPMTSDPAVPGLQEAPESAPSPAAALAFAARLAPIPQKPGEAANEPASLRPVPNLATFTRIPIRYAATAQILQNADDSGSDAARLERLFQIPEGRTDMAIPRPEVTNQMPSAPNAPATQEAIPTARAERVIEPPAASPTSAHDIRVQLPDNGGGATQVRFVESGGEVKVSVRTGDPALAQNLRSHLDDLTQRLADAGIPAEIWKPASSAGSSENHPQNPDREGRGSQGQPSGGNSGQQQHRGDRRPAWLAEMEASLHAQA